MWENKGVNDKKGYRWWQKGGKKQQKVNIVCVTNVLVTH